ncbi:MAG: ABC transporter ATP-binding protein [Candidatus Methanoperedens sp.]|nr:ABC transporter ATP-binding protein [Candidatus Methanoperedens sp.]
MSKAMIKINNLSKRYRIGAKEQSYRTIRETIMDGLRAPVRNLAKLRKLTEFKASDDEEDVIWALKDVSFEVNEGEVLGIIGRNGAGKSTFLKILSRITEPTSGSIEVHGRVSSLLEVGTGFNFELTGRENVFLQSAILGMQKWEIKEKFDDIVRFADIERFIDTPVKRYSSGMYVRLAFSVAAHLEPEILVVDEVLAVGDISFQKKCLGKMSEVARRGRTVLFVSHNMDAVQKLCTRAIILDEGRVVMDGPTDEVVSRYLGEEMNYAGQRIWSDINKAPGSGMVRLCAVRVLDQNGKACTSFDVRDPVSIETEFQVMEEGHRLVVQLHFVSEMGNVLFISNNNLDSPWRDTACPQGHYRAVCHIPGDFLNEGKVSVTCRIDTVGLYHYMHVMERDLVRFKVSDRMDPAGVRGNYSLQWPSGGIRPRLPWTVEKAC